MNSELALRDLDTGEEMVFRVVFPSEANADQHRISVLAPLGYRGVATPYNLLLAALGSCTSMTVGMYARRKQWPLMRVTVRLSHSRVHARDCAVCDTEKAMLSVIDRDVEFDGPLSDAQRERLLAIANRCPVHLTLTSKIDVRTTLRAATQEQVQGGDPATS